MANFHRSKSDYDDRRRCKRHPKHHQSPGVCSLCLAEKLSQIVSATSSRKVSDSLSSSCSSSYNSSASSCSSCSSPNPPYGYNTDRRKAFVFSASSIFKKSRSMAFAPRLRRGTESDSGKNSNLGFWSRFLRRPRRKIMEFEEVLMHSRTVVQRDVHG